MWLQVTLGTGLGGTRTPSGASGATANGSAGGTDAGLSDKERVDPETRYLEGFAYRAITAEKKTLIQRHTTTSNSGETSRAL